MKGLGGVVLMFMLLNLTISCYGQLRPGFYLGKCKRGNEFFNVEAIIRGVVEAEFRESRDGPKMAAALLRLQFHDCFVTGCDASLLLDGPDSEKKADANGSVRGYDVIDKVKAALEIACPGVVSCSDIIAVATRDAVKLSKGLSYRVETGRRDTVFVSKKGDVNLPSPSITVKDSVKLFESKGINKADMVLLLAAHTVGITHCAQVHGRLYNFRNKGKRDPTMGDDLFNSWSKTCPRNGGPNKEIALDQTPNSINVVDTGYLKQIKVQRGVLEIDQGLGLAPETAEIVRSYADGPLSKFFLSHFGEAMIKLGRVGVLTGKNGEVRRFCNAVNNPKPVQPTPVQPKPDGPTPKPAGGLTSLGL
ncbi:peroxidase 60-like [Papaver somniferum]|uniref:peroxidase 60-like n=1 Tax=Papaver somniferum TaxID=3469 RepID=UPI000E6F93B0|nr:peroxidase 60-like [Papaver somniferum]